MKTIKISEYIYAQGDFVCKKGNITTINIYGKLLSGEEIEYYSR